LGGNNLHQRGNKRQPNEVTEADFLIAPLEETFDRLPSRLTPLNIPNAAASSTKPIVIFPANSGQISRTKITATTRIPAPQNANRRRFTVSYDGDKSMSVVSPFSSSNISQI
jgi:hypothetical protein